MFATFLRRGIAAGLLAGLLCGFFALFFGEPSVDGAIQVEEATAANHPAEASADQGHKDIFSRSTQKIGLLVATGLFGVTGGGIFGLAYAYFRDRLSSSSEWSRSLSLAGAAFLGAFLIPFLKYPANPPGIGSPETITSRTEQYYAMVALSLVVVIVAWYVARKLRERGTSAPIRQLSVVLGSAVVVGVLFWIFPATASSGEFPAGLLWDFRLASLGTQLVFWTGLGAIFGLLSERANHREPFLKS